MNSIHISDVGENSLERVNEILSGFPNGALKATYAALKRAGATAKTRAGQFAAAEYAIKKRDFMQNVTTKTHVDGGRSGVASLSISFAGNVIPLTTFQTTVGKDGRVYTRVKRSSAKKQLDHAFKAQMNNHTGIYERVGLSRFPVEQKFGPSTGHMMQNEEIVKKMEETVRSTYEKRIEHEIQRVMNGWGA